MHYREWRHLKKTALCWVGALIWRESFIGCIGPQVIGLSAPCANVKVPEYSFFMNAYVSWQLAGLKVLQGVQEWKLQVSE